MLAEATRPKSFGVNTYGDVVENQVPSVDDLSLIGETPQLTIV